MGRDGPELAVRNDTRVMWDDAGEADALLARITAAVPRVLMGLPLSGANPRLRLYRYGPGEKFVLRTDVVYGPPGAARVLGGVRETP